LCDLTLQVLQVHTTQQPVAWVGRFWLTL